MTLEQIQGRVREIIQGAADDEWAHGAEDQLREDFIKWLAEHGPSAVRGLAKEVLRTNDIPFARWCA